jgi:hypothetical protein
MDWIDQKYISLLSNRLEKFKRQRGNSYNFRCPICGDSKKDKNKTRGYIFEKPQVGTLYYCHNCHVSLSLKNFIKEIDQALADEYTQEKFVDKNSHQSQVDTKPDLSKFSRPKFASDKIFKTYKKISQLSHDHPVKKYVVNRRIPTIFHHKLYLIPKFKSWVNTIIPEKFDTKSEEFIDEPRLVIPFLDKEGNCFGFQGRSFKKDGIRYITIIIDESKPKIYGLDMLKEEGTVFVVEGPIDSMFLPNCIAMAGSSAVLSEAFPNKPANEFVVVYDNEPRNKEIIKMIEKAIDKEYNVVIWPSNVEEKDVNDMVIAGLDPEQLVRENTFRGLEAKMKLVEWKKV